MTQLWFPGLKFNGIKLSRGQLLDISLMGVGLVIPPVNLTLLPAFTIWEPFIIFDSDWVVAPLTTAIAGIPKLFIDFITGRIEEEAEKYRREHPERG
jgi:hypothetical protein